MTADWSDSIVPYMSKCPTIKLKAIAAVLKALSNPHRLEIFMRLAKLCSSPTICCEAGAEDRCVGEVAKGLGVSPSTVSHHLKELRSMGLITMARHGRNIECSVNVEALREIESFFSTLLPVDVTSENRQACKPSARKKGRVTK